MMTDQAESGASTVETEGWYAEMMQSVEAKDAFYRYWRAEFGKEVTDEDGAYEMAFYLRGRYDTREEAQALLDGQDDRIDALIEETRRWQRLFVFVTNRAKQVEAERDAMREVATFLFDRLDDIDTLYDACKGDQRIFYVQVARVHARRFEVATTDGYTVTFKIDATRKAADE